MLAPQTIEPIRKGCWRAPPCCCSQQKLISQAQILPRVRQEPLTTKAWRCYLQECDANMFVDISAKQNLGHRRSLSSETHSLQGSSILELKANPDTFALVTFLRLNSDRGRASGCCLVTRGTLTLRCSVAVWLSVASSKLDPKGNAAHRRSDAVGILARRPFLQATVPPSRQLRRFSRAC